MTTHWIQLVIATKQVIMFVITDLPSWVKHKIAKLNVECHKRKLDDRYNRISNIRLKVNNYFEYDDNHNLQIKLKMADKNFDSSYTKKMAVELTSNVSHIIPSFDEFDTNDKIQIIICSRTHTQLNQFIKEVKKLDPQLYCDVRFAIASSRQYLCVNKHILSTSKGSVELLNDECRRSKCQFKSNITPIIESTISYPLDQSELRLIGSENCLSSCPYYASKHTIKYADVILAPYNFIINKSLRESSGLKIDHNILIFDEAHNLGDAITNSTSVSFTTYDSLILLEQIRMYTNKYNSILSQDTKFNLGTITKLLESFTNIKICVDEKVIDISQFLVECGIATLSIHSIIDFLTNSEICLKIRSYAEGLYSKLEYNYNKETSIIYMFREFLNCILLCTKDDKIIISHQNETPYYEGLVSKFINDTYLKIEIYSLSIFDSFSEIITSARSVMLVSGTLTPIHEYLMMIPSTKDKVRIFRNPGIFTIDKIYCNIISTTPSNNNVLNFTHEKRTDRNTMEGLCQIISNLSLVVPEGLLVFFTSFNYMHSFLTFGLGNRYKMNQFDGPLSSLKKNIFIEGTTPNLMEQYTKSAINGAVLFAIFGAKFSEGIDFSDHLARAIILIGLPYPPESSKLKLKEQYYRIKSQSTIGSRTTQIDLSSQLNILNINDIKASLMTETVNLRKIICFKTINQAIGRAIRHINDYAAIILIDNRYLQQSNISFLSQNVYKSLHYRRMAPYTKNINLDNVKKIVNYKLLTEEFTQLLAELQEFYQILKCKINS